jgi:UPF0755 protein
VPDDIDYRPRSERKNGRTNERNNERKDGRMSERATRSRTAPLQRGATEEKPSLEELRASVRQNKERHTRHLDADAEPGSRALRPKGSKGPALAIAMLAVIAAVIASIVFCGWFTLVRSTGPEVEAGQEVAIIIPEGSGVKQIGDILVERGIVSNSFMFQIMARLKSGGSYFHAGRYLLVTGSGYDAAIAALSVAPQAAEVVRVTIIEGLRIDQVAQAVGDQLGLSPSEFIERATTAAPDYVDDYPYLAGAYGDSLEGFLFPDTYEFTTDSTVDDVIERQLARFDEVWNSLEVPAERLDRYRVAELVTIASLTEREASLDDERPLVASVIDNRLDEGMMLEFCSTVQFLLPPDRLTDLRLTNDDLDISSPYNTYRNAGLPPGPICNPSKASLEAAVRPSDSEFFFFVLTGTDGSQTFSKTLAEHEAALQISYEVFGQ